MNAGRVFLNIVLNADWLRRLRAGESRNVSHGHPGEVKEILKKDYKHLVSVILSETKNL